MLRTYQLLNVSVTAIKITPESVEQAVQWCGGVQIEEIHPIEKTKRFVAINFPTLDGVKRAQEGDYIVKSENGAFTVMNGYEFEHKYELIP